ncbi:MAG: hypothetical protein HC879_09880 [Leptolyngbyaceae cyanobacterium SL_5_9]|nr:hypothetical protein [Leptolyngbyaceae cyanobacterium SL_5_9]
MQSDFFCVRSQLSLDSTFEVFYRSFFRNSTRDRHSKHARLLAKNHKSSKVHLLNLHKKLALSKLSTSGRRPKCNGLGKCLQTLASQNELEAEEPEDSNSKIQRH